ncbi:tagaturonate reductase [Aquimarina sp. U1-2]|uniref:tagaturonate reductase n=1 Tax=Aquimarina sp. U1-2 TaxID=2823141 RepID=UPI001AECB0FC|nr:tagaturonate reductase [Aquimarina sp. U1-2]MBP2831445.1 tagaturonate reductase [Aquimarina sp. U1-2]
MKKLNRSILELDHKRPIKVLQFGKGNFLRGFADWIIDILNEKTIFNGNVQIIESTDNGLAKKLNDQEGLYHVLLEGLQNGMKIQETRLVTCVNGIFNPKDDYKTFLKMGKNPDLQIIISNTTEAGIRFDPNDTDVNQLPRSFPGRLTALLYYRFLHCKNINSHKIFVLPCELIDSNGDALKDIVLQYIQLWKLPERFKGWIDTNIEFCNTLVDRIVTGFPKDTSKETQKQLDFEDHMIVTAEPFYLWVIEGPKEIQDIFPTEQAGLNVKFVNDLSKYKTRKVRILNAAHTTMVPFAYLSGFRTVKEAIEDKKIGDFINNVIYQEIIPTLDLPKEELTSFADSVTERFKNPFVKHHLISIALNSISKFKVRVLPSLLKYHNQTQKLPQNLVKSLAYLILFYRGKEKDGQMIPIQENHEILNFFSDVWQNNTVEKVVEIILENKELWGIDLNKIPNLKNSIFKEINAYNNTRD